VISNRILTIFSPTSAKLPAFIFGSLAIGIFINYLTELVSDNDLLSIMFIVMFSLLAAFFAWRGKGYKLQWSGGKGAKEYKGIITQLSTPGIIATLLQHHKGTIEHLWIITNFNQYPYSHFVSNQLPDMLKNANVQIKHHLIHFDDNQNSNIQESYDAIIKAMNEAKNKCDLLIDDVVVDITSGTKEMTAGVVMACVENNWNMSYVRSEYRWDEDTKKSAFIPGSGKVLEIEANFSKE
jgi:hypothetical protein